MTTLQIQKALKKAGFDPGPLDGVRGRKTIRAIKDFQRKNRLTPDGIVGPKTFCHSIPAEISRLSRSKAQALEARRYAL